jgi:protein O-GlcNAc transferase
MAKDVQRHKLQRGKRAQLQSTFNQAVALHQKGQLAAAEALYKSILQADPRHFDGLQLLGYLCYQTNRYQSAIEFISQAIKINPNFATTFLNLGLAFQALNRFAEALINYDKAIALENNFAEAYNNRGNVLKDLKRPNEALASYNKAIVLKPGFIEAYSNRGTALRDLKRLDEALASYDRAIELKPDYATAYNSRGNALRDLDRLDEAVASYDKALSLKPNDAEAYLNRGMALREAIKLDAARKDFEKALQLKPDHYRARWVLGLMDIPIIFSSEDEVEASRVTFGRSLHNLNEWFDSSKLNGAEEAIGSVQPFFLAYQEKNNRDLLLCYGRLCRRVMEYWQSTHAINLKELVNGEKIKVGIVSGHVRSHSVWDAIVKGWLLNFDSSKFEWHVFSLSSLHDETTELVRNKASSFVENAGSLKEWASCIVERRIEVLIYPEIGMDMLTAKLANLRLAPLQIATWGHPETTGLETIDYYLSADLLEPEDADSSYTESLIKLPNLGCTYTPHRVVPGTLELSELGINAELPVLLCPGSTFKYSPLHDGIFPQIARLLGGCTFIFFDQAPYRTAILKLRLKTVFEKENLIMEDYVKFIPWLPREKFYALMKKADVFMDTIGFSGFNTAIQAIECSLPVVTIDGQFLRGKLASGILKRINLGELICDSEKTYCDVVVRLVKDKGFRAQVVSKIDSRSAILYEDMEPLRA